MKSWKSYFGIGIGLLMGISSLGAVACGGDDDDDDNGAKAGQSGSGGSAGAGGGGNTGGSGGGNSGSGGGSGAGGGGKTPTFTGQGPGANLVCTSTEGNGDKNAYDTYGKEAFVAVNAEIIKLAVGASEDDVGGSFKDLAEDIDKNPDRGTEFTNNLGAFLIWAYGGPNEYYGPKMEPAHTGLNITQDQYDFFVSDVIVPALIAKGVDEDDIGSCFAPVVAGDDAQGFIDSIIER